MKLQLDTQKKTIKVEEAVKLSELVDILNKILPNAWKEYTLESNTIIQNWTNPIVIEKKIYEPYWYKEQLPYWTVTCEATCESDNKQLCQNTFNVEC